MRKIPKKNIEALKKGIAPCMSELLGDGPAFNNTQLFDLKDVLRILLGREGHICSGSKSCGPAMAVFNANVVIGDKIVWYGDVDMDEKRVLLKILSMHIGAPIEVYYESGLRQFNFEEIKRELIF